MSLRPLAFQRCVRLLTLALLTISLCSLDAQTPMTITIAGKAGTLGYVDATGSDARFSSSMGIAVDSAGNVFVADNNNSVIRKITPAGVVTTFAGSPGGYGYVDGTGTAARFSSPQALAIDAQGNLYVGDNDSMVRKITPAGVVTTLAGANGSYAFADGTGTQARLRAPRGLAVDANGNVYVADAANYAIRKITPAGVVTTLAGTPSSNGSLGEPLDGVGAAARFGSPWGIAFDGSGNLIVTDGGWRLIRKVTLAGVVTTIAGTRNGFGVIDGTGTNAVFDYPHALATHPSGDVYIMEEEMQVIRKITPAGVVTTVMGVAGLSGAADGADRDVRFNWPGGMAFDSAGRLFIADTRNYTIRERLITFTPTLTALPSDTTVTAGANVTLTAGATGTPAPTYQWQKNGTNIPGATATSLTIANVRSEDAGNYTFVATNIAGSAASPAAVLRVQLPPAITTQPQSQSITEGQSITLSVGLAGTSSFAYRWQRNGVDVAGAVNATLTLSNAIPDSAGTYTVVVTNEAGSVTTIPAVVTVLSSRFANLSVRTTAGSDAAALIVGFVVTGSGKPLLIRGIGAALGQFGVAGALADPRLMFYQGPLAIDSNDDWSSSPNSAQIATAANRLGAFALPSPSRDAALLRTVNANSYTVMVTPATGGAGVALAELYDANVTGEGKLVNLSARAPVDSANILIAGFVITGNVKKRVLVRGVGPTLAGFGVSGALPNPRLTVFQNNISILAVNDDWDNDATLRTATAQAGAFPLVPGSADAALLLILDPGAYSVQLTGTGNSSGTALIEVYEVP